MKTRIIILFSLVILSVNAPQVLAQKFTSPVKEVYNSLSQRDDLSLSAVYITKSMLKFSMSIASAVSNDAQIDSLKLLVDNMDEIILLGDMSSTVFGDEQIKTLRNALQKKGYDLMVQMKERGEELNVYVLEDGNSEKIRDLVVIVKEQNERMVLSISGHMTTKELAAVASLADIDIGDFIPL